MSPVLFFSVSFFAFPIQNEAITPCAGLEPATSILPLFRSSHALPTELTGPEELTMEESTMEESTMDKCYRMTFPADGV